MKIIILLIISIISIINGSQYVNFQPYANSNSCKGQSAGIGYSILLDECMSFDQNTTYIFSQSNNKIDWIKFGKYTGDNDCETTPITKGSWKNGACIKNENIAFDSATLPITNSWYKISITNEPIILEGAYVKQYMDGDCNNSNSIVMVDYYSNATKAIYNSTGVPYSYYCSSENEPYSYTCSIWGCYRSNTAEDCKSVSPFSNSSSNYYYSVYCNLN